MMINFTLCCSCAAGAGAPAATNWQQLGLPQLILGETSLQATPQRQIIAEVAHTALDEPELLAVLRLAALHATTDWLLLLPGDALLTPAAIESLVQLTRSARPRQLVMGRAWRCSSRRLPNDLSALDPSSLEQHLDAESRLDPPGSTSWMLLPRGTLHTAPPDLSALPERAIPWLLSQASVLGWPVLEATPSVPLLRPQASPPAATPQTPCGPRPPCTGVVLPHAAGLPRLSLLVAAPQDDLDALASRLRPAASLPWEVITRPDLRELGAGSTAAAWNSALADAKGELVWPIANQQPALAFLPLVLQLFDAPWVDLVQFACRLGGHHHPAALAAPVQPGCLVAQRSWLERVGGFDETLAAGPALHDIKARSLACGAAWRAVPLEAIRA